MERRRETEGSMNNWPSRDPGRTFFSSAKGLINSFRTIVTHESAMEQGQQYTRLIVSNLPPSLTEDLLKSHVCRCPSEPPRLTDIKILRKPDGTSRRIAFLGFKATAEAERILRWLDGSYVQGISSGARVKVDWAKDVSLASLTVAYILEAQLNSAFALCN